MLRRPPTRIELSIDDKEEYLEAKRLAALSSSGKALGGQFEEESGRAHDGGQKGDSRMKKQGGGSK